MHFKTGRRDIQALRVKCANVDRGCEWEGTVGTLEGHMATCKFTLVPCPNKCKDDSSKVKKFVKKDLEKHLEEDCSNRPAECQHCGEKGTYVGMQTHDATCERKEVPCPEVGCTESRPRGDMKGHIERECLFSMTPCKFANIGCKRKLERKEKAAHEEDANLHFKMALDAVVELKDTNAKLQTLSSKTAITFALSDYRKTKEAKKIVTFPPFYSSPNGYRMALRVDAAGNGCGAGTHVSVFTPLLEGVYDAGLKWPLVGRVTITLLNQVEDKNHHICSLPCLADDNRRVGSVWGRSQFIPHSALAHDPVRNTQYLKDDTLYFRVSVEVADRKPWLECSIKTLT